MAEGPPPAVDWRTGSWADCLRSIEALSADRAPDDVRTAIKDCFSEDELEISRFHQRQRKILMLAECLFGSPGREVAAREAARFDQIAEGVKITAQAAALAGPALLDPSISAGPQREAKPMIRKTALEDVELVFDLDEMAECSFEITRFLLVSAVLDSRFDDFRMGLRIAGIHLDGAVDDLSAALTLSVSIVAACLSLPVVSERDASERLAQIARLVTAFEPTLRHIKGDDEYRDEVKAIFAQAKDADRDSFPTETGFANYGAVLDRLEMMFRETGNPFYLDDLILFCDTAREGESPRQKARRLSDLAAALNWRGRAMHRRSDLHAAVSLQQEALECSDPDDPRHGFHQANAASMRLTQLEEEGKPIGAEIEVLRPLLPRLPGEDGFVEEEGDGEPYIIRAAAELLAALELEGEDPAAYEQPLYNAIASCELALRCPLAPIDRREAVAFYICARAARRAVGLDDLHPGDLEPLARLLADPRAAEAAFEAALNVAGRLVATSELARRELRDCLQEARAVTSSQSDERLAQYFGARRLLALIALLEGDVLTGGERAADVVMLMYELRRGATFMARAEQLRSSSSSPRAQASVLARECAIQLIAIGAVDTAAVLIQDVAAMAVSDAILPRDGKGASRDLFAEQVARIDSCSCLMLIVGFQSVAVLARAPGEQWRVTSVKSSAAIDHFSAVDWSRGEQIKNLFEMKAELTSLSQVLADTVGDVLVELQADAAGPVLCLPTGMPTVFPLACVSSVRPEIDAGIATVPGPLTDGGLEALARPLAGGPVLLLAGAAIVEGAGELDPAKDQEEIEAAGLRPTVVASTQEGWVEALEEAEVVHYAGHLFPLGPDETALPIADGSGIPLGTIRALSLPKLRVATLVACYSGFSTQLGAEQIEHAAGAFLEAGASAVVATLWPVLDRPAHLFARAFYGGLAAGSSVADSFKAGIDGVRGYRVGSLAPYEHPIYWAGFTLFSGVGAWWKSPKQPSDLNPLWREKVRAGG